MEARLTPEAQADLAEIWDFIAVSNLEAADRAIQEIDAAIMRLERYPDIGHRHAHIPDPTLNVIPAEGWLVVYRVRATWIQVVRIVHGRKDLSSLDF